MELADLSLHICNLLLRELVLVKRHLGHLQEPQKAKLARQEEEQALARLAGTSRSANAVDVVTRVIWRVKLDDPVDFRNVETASRHICAEQDASRGIAEFEECVGALLLLLLSLDFQLNTVEDM